MKVTIEIPDEKIQEAVTREVVNQLVSECLEAVTREVVDQLVSEYLEAIRASRYERWFRQELREIGKQYLYTPEVKQKIINSVVNYATDEIRRRALPLITERLIGDKK